MLLFVLVAVVLRLVFLAVSLQNEKHLRAQGAVEFGAATTRLLALAHIAFYLSAAAEGLSKGSSFDLISLLGISLYAIAMGMLVIVVRVLGQLWTIKLLVSPRHTLIRSGPYAWFRHPNYFLNILPELVGYAVALHAFMTLLVGLPIYFLILVLRIRQENEAMRQLYREY
jgi:isoprenylcysteine carboxyl methyltransferase (ICMT) family protein YpbQ